MHHDGKQMLLINFKLIFNYSTITDSLLCNRPTGLVRNRRGVLRPHPLETHGPNSTRVAAPTHRWVPLWSNTKLGHSS